MDFPLEVDVSPQRFHLEQTDIQNKSTAALYIDFQNLSWKDRPFFVKIFINQSLLCSNDVIIRKTLPLLQNVLSKEDVYLNECAALIVNFLELLAGKLSIDQLFGQIGSFFKIIEPIIQFETGPIIDQSLQIYSRIIMRLDADQDQNSNHEMYMQIVDSVVSSLEASTSIEVQSVASKVYCLCLPKRVGGALSTGLEKKFERFSQSSELQIRKDFVVALTLLIEQKTIEDDVCSIIINYYTKLCKDESYVVRAQCASKVSQFLKNLDQVVIQEVVLELFLALQQDISNNVVMEAKRQIVPLALVLQQEISKDLVKNFCSMAYQGVGRQQQQNAILCSSQLPQLLELIGHKRWEELQECYNYLFYISSKDRIKYYEVLVNLAQNLSKIVKQLDSDKIKEIIIPKFMDMINDDEPQVRELSIENFSTLISKLSIKDNDTLQIVHRVFGRLKDEDVSNSMQWRQRYIAVQQIGNLIENMSSGEGFQLINSILQILISFCEDATSAVRQVSAKELGTLMALLERWSQNGQHLHYKGIILQALHKFGSSNNYQQRQVAAIALCSYLYESHKVQQLEDVVVMLQSLSQDRVLDVKITLFDRLLKAYDRNEKLHTISDVFQDTIQSLHQSAHLYI